MWSCFTGQAAAFDAAATGLPDLAPYKALRQIGRGAVGEVFLARHAGDGQLYAVKTVPLDAPSWRIELLKREERTYAALATDAGAHVGLLRPCRMQLLHDRLCLVTEWAAGGTLATFLQSPRYARGVPEDLAVFVLRQLVAAVERLHTNHVAYRDIKLENILIDTATFGAKAPRVLLADFGTCKAWEDGEASCLASTFMGTPGFMAPQVLGSIFNLRRDSGAPSSGLDDSACEAEAASAPGDSVRSSGPNLPGGGGVNASAARSGAATYDAVKADIYSLGAILMFMLFKELPFGFDKFSRLLPPGEALSVLWQLESEQSWREAAGPRLLRRRAAPEALDLLDRMLDPDEDSRADLAAIKAHPWFSRRLPRRYEAAAAALAKEQARLDAARCALQDRSARRRPSAAAAAAADASASAHSRGLASRSRPQSGIEAALEQLLDAASSRPALRRLRESRTSIFVDLAPESVADAWELGLQSEPSRPPKAAPAACGCAGRGAAAGAAADDASSDGGSVAGRSDSATTTLGVDAAAALSAVGKAAAAPPPPPGAGARWAALTAPWRAARA
ncbi:MAG: kinase-like domain-containing protein [Monoraphidium minutum]|nr:MAG: kinase-like domain-containing protein [Monoraphidium minutum]